MDIAGYIFIGIVVISAITGLCGGFFKTLMALISSVGSMAISAVITPKMCELELVKRLIEDAPITIGETQFYFMRTLIVFSALSLIFFVICLVVKGLFKWIFDRAQALKLIDKILGAIFSVAVVWMAFGILFAISIVGAEWAIAIDEQLTASTGINVGLANIVNSVTSFFNQSQILTTVYQSFNPIGELVKNLIFPA